MTEAGFTGFERGVLGSTAENLSSLDYQIQKDIYTAYRKAGYSKKYYDAHESDIIIHKAAKKAFDDPALKKLPTVKSLQAEYSDLLVQKKLDYAELSKARDEAKRLRIYKANAEMLLRTDADDQRQKREHQQENSTAMQGAAEREPFDQSGGWGEFPQQAAGEISGDGNLPVRQVCINAGIACQV